MNDNILTSTKTLAGLASDYDCFDDEFIMYINSVFLVLKQLGVGPANGFVITDKNVTWNSFIPDNAVLREAVKMYMGAKVRLKFDPPAQSSLYQAYSDTVDEFEFRLPIEAQGSISDPSSGDEPTGGVSDYTKLSNLPSINGKTLIGNYDEEDPTVKPMTPSVVDDIWDEEFS